jgi:hypothetical protein
LVARGSAAPQLKRDPLGCGDAMSGQFLKLVGPALFLIALAGTRQGRGIRPEAVCTYPALFVGPCYTVHGEMYAANGSPSVRIWIVGTKRILGVHEDMDPGDCPLPAHLDSLVAVQDQLVYADFVVRPVTPEHLGWMRMVCVASARRIVTRPAYFLHPPPQ